MGRPRADGRANEVQSLEKANVVPPLLMFFVSRRLIAHSKVDKLYLDVHPDKHDLPDDACSRYLDLLDEHYVLMQIMQL